LTPLYPQKRKNWQSIENFNRPNSGTVSHIQFKLGIGIDHPVESCDMTPRSKSKGQSHKGT